MNPKVSHLPISQSTNLLIYVPTESTETEFGAIQGAPRGTRCVAVLLLPFGYMAPRHQGHLREPLFLRVGMLDVGSVFRSALHSAQVHGLQHEVLTGEELNRRFPAYRVPEHWMALYQPDGGVLAPERIVQTPLIHIAFSSTSFTSSLFSPRRRKAHVSTAQRLGAEVLTWHSVASWRVEGSAEDAPVTFQVEPTTTTTTAEAAAAATGSSGGSSGAHGSRTAGGGGGGNSLKRFTAGAAVFTPGPWIGQLVPELRELCVPERQVVGWFEIEAASRHHFAPDRFPVFVLEESPGGAAYYGFPEHGDVPGFKVGLYRHLREEIRDPAALDSVRRTADAADEAALRAGVSSYFPAAASGRMLAASTCFFTNTPDGHFLVDRHPRHPQVILCSACSGHGFKMSSGIGQLIARMGKP
ncbi:hypothetical protein VOLCADRAFT_91743 [Volvox carteri f. nagariensis]|uniref:FAD dependent oxidoreductase domain-containing protein n=1 Tax=Volvox carteri f. nagariensis TaxID=3068 RepID=D8TXV0_VOLCA|nr:uncharacterized protein VOLCADRAFT_91743 [Volvox carteri f. nagariensis]EFJ47708.1 hypothetical protein VOLCADRAFT_91743 [Volvox carteri f. nagariensis]|eukprot:XP_002951179.1 hypothetical protein VOLCADRAFT_91743 [Volvox carteri f. nagariensis]